MRGFFFHNRGMGRGDERAFGHRDGFGRGPGFRGGFGRFGGARDSRGFGHGGLRLVLLKLIAEKPSHGYELIKAIEERFNGAYSPSPGVIYPTLSWLEDEGFATVATGDDGRKSYTITEAGQSFLADKADQVDQLFEMMDRGGGEHGDYAPLMRAMHNLRSVVKLRGMKPMAKAEIEAIVDMLDETAKRIERL
ncbi:MAG: PadR family transcriptional regulator [Asticcacaulis sp.]|nr:PadR family transcriptional regulator [Asticcacaulis sp.]